MEKKICLGSSLRDCSLSGVSKKKTLVQKDLLALVVFTQRNFVMLFNHYLEPVIAKMTLYRVKSVCPPLCWENYTLAT